MKGHTYKFDKIVVGGNFCAMAYAYFMGYPIVYKNLNPPHTFDTLDNEESKLDKYRDFCLLLSLSGLIPCGEKAESIRIHDNKLRVSIGAASVVVIEFNSNSSDEDGGRSEGSSQPRGPSRMNGSPGRGLSLPEPHSNTGV